ncbi:lymphocyte antigen 6E isoform X2 [Meles meles]|uniref:lymphocyte antigen 6E isoform X2 n=2 Tax=Meles meles TaxID=9662 RepID=UPI001E69B182|nr:lymphocyte antigen 6E isoform X2 [Meles meles]
MESSGCGLANIPGRHPPHAQHHHRQGPVSWTSFLCGPEDPYLWLCESPDRTPISSGMKVFLPVLLAALLGVERACSLVCFSCTNQNSNFYCLKPTVCSDSDNYCVTVSASAGLGKLVDFGHTLNKGCSPICPSPSVNLGVASIGTYCCRSFLCNVSGAGRGLRASAAVLGLGLLLGLLPALQRLGP